MGRIEWTRMSGDDIEEMLAVMLLRKYPHGRHVKANPGDGGIDVFVPDRPGSPVGTNYQIKRFAEKIGDSQKDQIRDSLKSLQQTTEAGQFIATHCHVAAPLLPTATDYSWLSKASERFSFTTEWYGLSHIEGLVAQYPDVVDYYLRGRAEYFTGVANNLIALARDAMSIQAAGDTRPITPTEVASHLAKLERLVNEDPFYVYHFRTSPTEPDFTEKYGIVASFAEKFSDELYIAIDMYARFEDAVRIRPCRVKFKAAPANDLEREQFEGLARFGAPAQLTASLELVDFPGGLGGKFPSAMVSLEPVPTGKPAIHKYEILDEDGVVIAECLLETLYASRGLREPNYLHKVTDLQRVFEIEWRFDVTNKTTSMTFTWSTIVGRVAAEVKDSLNFLAHLEDGTSLRISELYIPRKARLLPLTPFSHPTPWKVMNGIVANLVTIQGVADRQVVIPDPSVLDQDTIDDIVLCARLAHGREVRGEWASMDAGLVGPEFDTSLFRKPSSMRASGIKELTIGDDVYILGEAEVIHESAVLELGPEGDDGRRPARFVPGSSNVNVMRMVSQPVLPSNPKHQK